MRQLQWGGCLDVGQSEPAFRNCIVVQSVIIYRQQ